MGINNIYGWTTSKNMPVNGFKWVKEVSEFDENFIRSYNEEGEEIYFS